MRKPERKTWICPDCRAPCARRAKRCKECDKKRRREGAALQYKVRGYVFVYAPSHPRATKNGYVKRAVLVLEEKLGRMLKAGELSHHKGAKDDDRPEMLEVHRRPGHAIADRLGGRTRTSGKYYPRQRDSKGRFKGGNDGEKL